MQKSSLCQIVLDKNGIDEEKLAYIKIMKRGRIEDYLDAYSDAKYFEGKTPWTVECVMALPRATQNELKAADAKTLVKNGCKLIGEGANMPCTTEAKQIFQKNKVLYSPG